MDDKIVNTCSVRHLIVDSAGFLKDANLKDIGEYIYTIDQVVSEIRDKATRSRLQVLPYDLLFRTPSAESIKFVTEFSRKTGDYASLSSVDLKVIALAYQLHKEHADASQIKSEPNKNVQIETKPRHIAVPKGFYFEKNYKNEKDDKHLNDDDKDEISKDNDEVSNELKGKCVIDDKDEGRESVEGVECCSDEEEWFSSEDLLDEDVEGKDVNDDDDDDDKENGTIESSEDDEDKIESTNDDDDDDEGWITPKNIGRKMPSDQPAVPTEPLKVACLTTDFAMQNVLIQMGLSIVSLNGLLIRHARSYVLKCSACFKVTKDVSKVFCHHCGNQTLQKVAMTVNEDGSVVYHVNRNRQPNLRGLRYALPTPKGGKHAHNPILCSDQLSVRYRGSRKQLDPLHPDFIARDQPFSMHALNAKGGRHGAKNWDVQPTVGRRKNPNENRKGKRMK